MKPCVNHNDTPAVLCWRCKEDKPRQFVVSPVLYASVLHAMHGKKFKHDRKLCDLCKPETGTDADDE